MQPTPEQKRAFGREVTRLCAEQGINAPELGRRIVAITNGKTGAQAAGNWMKGTHAPRNDEELDALETVLCPDDRGHLIGYLVPVPFALQAQVLALERLLAKVVTWITDNDPDFTAEDRGPQVEVDARDADLGLRGQAEGADVQVPRRKRQRRPPTG